MTRDETFEDALQMHGPMIARIVSTYEARPALSEELVQETLMALWRALPKFRAEASLATFIARITHNVCVTHVRKASKLAFDALDDDYVDKQTCLESDASRQSERRALLAAVRELPLRDRQIVSLHLEGFSNREVGETLGLSEGNVGVRLTRLRAAIKTMIGGQT